MNDFGFWFILWAAKAGEQAPPAAESSAQAVLLVILWGAACCSLVCAVLAQHGRRDR